MDNLPEGDVWIPLGGCLWFDEFDFASPAANLDKKMLVSTTQKGLATTTFEKSYETILRLVSLKSFE